MIGLVNGNWEDHHLVREQLAQLDRAPEGVANVVVRGDGVGHAAQFDREHEWRRRASAGEVLDVAAVEHAPEEREAREVGARVGGGER